MHINFNSQMFLAFVICVAVAALSAAAANIDLDPMERGQSDSKVKITDYSASKMREKRMVPILIAKGLEAVRKLFKGTEQTRSYVRNTDNFIKQGDFNTAYRDFLSVRPTGIKQRSTTSGIKYVQGRKDGLKLKIRSPGYKGKADAILDVIDFGDRAGTESYTYSIMYMKNMPKSKVKSKDRK